MKYIFSGLLASLLTMTLSYAQQIGYQRPVPILAELADAALTPVLSLSPDRETLLLMERPGLPPIAELAAEELHLAGLRIDPRTNGSSRAYHYTGLSLRRLDERQAIAVIGLPHEPQLENVAWSPDGSKIAFTHTTSSALELWIIDVTTATARKIENIRVNDAMGMLPYRWFSDSQRLLICAIPSDRGLPPVATATPKGPVVQENDGKAGPVRTYQDLLKGPHDEALFTYYATSDLVSYDVRNNTFHNLGLRGIFSQLQIAPGAEFFLLQRLQRPFSYAVPYYRFGRETAIYKPDGTRVRVLADLPASEHLPKGFNSVPEGPRQFCWRADKAASLYWVEAQDGGDPQRKVQVRDRLFRLEAPFNGKPEAALDLQLRYRGITWGDDDLAIIHEFWWSTRREIISAWRPRDSQPAKEALFDRSYEDRYTDPGDFQTAPNQYGRHTLLRSTDNNLYLMGMGASPAGNRPFVDIFDLESRSSRRLWRSAAPYFEVPMVILDPKQGMIISRRESEEDPPNYFLRYLKEDKLEAITDFPHPYKSMKGVTKELLRYKRADGVDLTGTLYLPPGYDVDKDGPLPVLMWAYPREYKSRDAAGQVRQSPHEFIRLYPGSPVFWVMRGFAVFDRFAMPIVGEGDQEPNETFIAQLVAGARAAVNELTEMGIADPERIAVGGHSYGAFMTANLLAHTDLFAAGIARSGAYNRTLTPFGFQSEERTFWEVPDIYFSMSPFMHADKIQEPLLLIHGQEDSNSGTYPMQSERFYAALKGHGATTRLVLLPKESHGYRARESIMHMLWEMDQWLLKHVQHKHDNGQTGNGH